MLKKITSILCVLLGIAVIVLGLTFDTNVSKHDVDEKSFRISSNTYDLDYASFGADFYTYIYRGSDTIVDVLDEMNKSTETIVKAENGIYEAAAANIEAVDSLAEIVAKAGKTIILAIGIMIAALGLHSFGSAFTKPSPAAVIPSKAEDEPRALEQPENTTEESAPQV
ncbi:MAG: hypothetical protein IJK01_07290 [Clostridia bacterium]|nr:hypothetical protein [Clostridia bacterium]